MKITMETVGGLFLAVFGLALLINALVVRRSGYFRGIYFTKVSEHERPFSYKTSMVVSVIQGLAILGVGVAIFIQSL